MNGDDGIRYDNHGLDALQQDGSESFESRRRQRIQDVRRIRSESRAPKRRRDWGWKTLLLLLLCAAAVFLAMQFITGGVTI